MHKLIVSALVLLLYACHLPVESKKEDLKESAIKDYVRMIDSSTYFYDTSSYDYRILKAYVNNDSLFFLQMRQEQEKRVRLSKFIDVDSCVTLQPLKNLDVDKAYRNSPANAAFREIGIYLMKLSGEKDMCQSFD